MIKIYVDPIIIHLFYLMYFQLILHFNLNQLSICNLTLIMILLLLNQMKKYQIILNKHVNLIFKFIINNILVTYNLQSSYFYIHFFLV